MAAAVVFAGGIHVAGIIAAPRAVWTGGTPRLVVGIEDPADRWADRVGQRGDRMKALPVGRGIGAVDGAPV